MDWGALHDKAKAVQPAGVIQPKRYLVSVLMLGRSTEQTLGEFDFQWMKAHSKITVQTIRAKYMERWPETEVDLVHEGQIPSPDTIVKLLNDRGDCLIVFQAVEKRAIPDLQALFLPVHTPPQAAPTESCHVLAPNHERSCEPNDIKTVAPLTPISADQGNAAPPWDMLRDRGRPSVEPVARIPSYLHAALNLRESTWPLSDPPPSSRTPSHTSIPANTHNTPPEGASDQALSCGASRVNSLNDSYLSPAVKTESRSPAPIKAERKSPSPFQGTATQEMGLFNPEEVFARDVLSDTEYETKSRPTDRFIQQLIDQQSPELLEAGIVKSDKALEALKSAFSRYTCKHPDASTWIKAIEKLSNQPKKPRTVVGVVGNTGAGKSSVINALLDEERLVPTNCMRACTAVVTELSWNDSNDVHSKYRAAIEFISSNDWYKELEVIRKEFLTENGTVSKEIYDQNSDAGRAWAKFHAVYPKIHKDEVHRYTIQELMAEPSVTSVLGETRQIRTAYPNRFYTQLQKYVDSKEKTIGKKDKAQQKTSRSHMEHWPLIKVVKIYVKAAALSTGAVIVDLPGVHDSNAARAAVAEGYMKQCTGLWIVAPITRAVDDKAAKTLLGDSFRRQMKYDGNFSSVTFICSKTDDISITEATDSLELNDQVEGFEEQQRKYIKEIKSVKSQINELQDAIEVYKTVMDEADQDLEIWEDLKDQCEDGETVFAPKVRASKKRKRNCSEKDPYKRRQANSDGSDDVAYVLSDSDSIFSDSDIEGIQSSQEPLSHDDIKRKLEELRNTKKSARQEKAAVSKQISELKPKIRYLKDKIAGIRAEISAVCIAGRNEYSKDAIQQDFAAGIRELDMEHAAELDEEHFNPDEDLRNYEEVAQSLPVFCVSSRAYQKLCNRLRKDEEVPGFKTPEATEMPQLQAHCKKLTEAGRIQISRNFLRSFCQLLTTFALWASNDGSGLKMTDDDKRKQVTYLQKRLVELEKGLEQAVAACVQIMKRELDDQIFHRYPDLVEEAIEAAPGTSQRWGQRDQGGLFYSTYKAVVRRGGVYHSHTAGHRDFNADLLDPIIKKLATGWERAFQNRLPKAVEIYTKDSTKVLENFHTMIEERANQNGVGLANLALLKGSIKNYEQMFSALGVKLLADMSELQRDANRDFGPTIAAAMMTVYDICTDEWGTGSYMRMKNHMMEYVDKERHHMFAAATKTVEARLDLMCRQLEETMANRVDEIFGMMRADYMRVLGGVQVSHLAMSKEEKAMRADITELLLDINPQFERLAKGELDEESAGDEEGTETVDVAEEADEPWEFDDDAESIADSTQELVRDDTMHEGNDDTIIIETTPASASSRMNAMGGAKRVKSKQVYVSDEMDEDL